MNADRMRLLHLKETTEAVGEEMSYERARFARIANAEPTRAVSAFNLFQTPEAIADRMGRLLADYLPCGARWLEPSAGLGRLYRAGRGAGMTGPCVLVEQSPDCAAELYRTTGEGVRLVVDDFLACSADRLGGLFDGVIMNPPFKQGADIRHIEHAYGLLSPGGMLVALCYDGVRQNARLRQQVTTWEPLPPGSFKPEGTNAGAVLLTWTR